MDRTYVSAEMIRSQVFVRPAFTHSDLILKRNYGGVFFLLCMRGALFSWCVVLDWCQVRIVNCSAAEKLTPVGFTSSFIWSIYLFNLLIISNIYKTFQHAARSTMWLLGHRSYLEP